MFRRHAADDNAIDMQNRIERLKEQIKRMLEIIEELERVMKKRMRDDPYYALLDEE